MKKRLLERMGEVVCNGMGQVRQLLAQKFPQHVCALFRPGSLQLGFFCRKQFPYYD